jgi:hypothetical protein
LVNSIELTSFLYLTGTFERPVGYTREGKAAADQLDPALACTPGARTRRVGKIEGPELARLR